MESFASFYEHRYQSDKKQRITCVGHSDAPRVTGDIKNGVAFLVVVALIEAVVLVSQDVVHRDDNIFLCFAIAKSEIAHVVLRLAAARVGFNFKAVQSEAERQRCFRYLFPPLDDIVVYGIEKFKQ